MIIVDVFVCLVFKEQSVKNSFLIIFPAEPFVNTFFKMMTFVSATINNISYKFVDVNFYEIFLV